MSLVVLFAGLLFKGALSRCGDAFLSNLQASEVDEMAYFQTNQWYNEDTDETVTSMLMGDGNRYDNFLLVHPSTSAAFGTVEWGLNKNYESLKAVIGLAGDSHCIDDYGKDSNHDGIVYRFYVDNELKYTSNRLATALAYESINIDTTNGNTLRIEIEKGQSNACDNAVIAHPLLSHNFNELVLSSSNDVCDTATWKEIGVLSDVNQIYAGRTPYNLYEFEFGVKYNGLSVDAVIINLWNRGLRVTTVDDYPMGGDGDSDSLKFGRAIFTYNLINNPTDRNWYRYYYYIDNDEKVWTAPNTDCVKLYARQINSWHQEGTLSNIEKLLADDAFPTDKYEYGIEYNGFIHKVIINNWNGGIRVSTVDSYPQGDNAHTLKFGKSVFTKGLASSATQNDWYHQYVTVNGDKRNGSNGVRNGVHVYVKKRESKCGE